MSQNNYFLGFSDIARLEKNQCHDNAKEFMSFIALFGKKCIRKHGQINTKPIIDQLFTRGNSCENTLLNKLGRLFVCLMIQTAFEPQPLNQQFLAR